MVYAFPPFAVIPEVLLKVARSSMVCILVAPWWPAQAWFPDLLRLLWGRPVRLPAHHRMLCQPHRPIYHSRPQWLSLHAWPLSSSASDRRDFQTELRRLRLDISDPAHNASTSPIGGRSVPGARTTSWIPHILL